jgi:hypothetical protein
MKLEGKKSQKHACWHGMLAWRAASRTFLTQWTKYFISTIFSRQSVARACFAWMDRFVAATTQNPDLRHAEEMTKPMKSRVRRFWILGRIRQ